MRTIKILVGASLCLSLVIVATSVGAAPPTAPALDQLPEKYKNKHMPAGWWTDAAIIEEGRKLFIGSHENILDPSMTCAVCHGKTGVPVLTGSRDFRRASYMDQMTDSFWFWRVSEGVPKTPMPAWKRLLSKEDRWKVIAYEHTFSHGGKPAEHKH